MSNGTNHLELRCGDCNTFYTYLAQNRAWMYRVETYDQHLRPDIERRRKILSAKAAVSMLREVESFYQWAVGYITGEETKEQRLAKEDKIATAAQSIQTRYPSALACDVLSATLTDIDRRIQRMQEVKTNDDGQVHLKV